MPARSTHCVHFRAQRALVEGRTAHEAHSGNQALELTADELAERVGTSQRYREGDGSLANRFLSRIRHRLKIFTPEAQFNPIDQLLEFVRGNGDSFGAESKPPTELKLDGLNFPVRALVDLNHLTEFLAIRAVNGQTPQGCQPLICLL
jgi:hypothetical protein